MRGGFICCFCEGLWFWMGLEKKKMVLTDPVGHDHAVFFVVGLGVCGFWGSLLSAVKEPPFHSKPVFGLGTRISRRFGTMTETGTVKFVREGFMKRIVRWCRLGLIYLGDSGQ